MFDGQSSWWWSGPWSATMLSSCWQLCRALTAPIMRLPVWTAPAAVRCFLRSICGSPAVLSSALRRRGGRFFSAVGGDCRAARDNGHRQPRLQSCPPQTEEYVSPERRPTGKRTGGPAGRCERRPAGWASGITAAKGSADGYAEEASRRRHPDRGGLWRDARPGP